MINIRECHTGNISQSSKAERRFLTKTGEAFFKIISHILNVSVNCKGCIPPNAPKGLTVFFNWMSSSNYQNCTEGILKCPNPTVLNFWNFSSAPKVYLEGKPYP